MIARARPRFIYGKYEFNGKTEVNGDDFYLNSGSAAFCFFLKAYNKVYKRKAHVGIQSFTCTTMLDAIIQSGSEAFVFDVKKNDGSIALDLVKDIKLDIIVLTHYQGVPNRQYLDFAEYCKVTGTLLVDDLAHVSKSCIEGVQIGSLSNAYIESYRFDKPFAAICGGLLHINNIPEDFYAELRKEYKGLDLESEESVMQDINLLDFLIKYTEPENFKKDIDYMRFIENPFLLNLWSKKIFEFKIYRGMVKVICKLNSKAIITNIPPLYRINNLRIGFIIWQKENFNRAYKKLIKYNYTSLLGLSVNPFEKNGSFVWNRYSLIDESKNIRKALQEKGIMAGNYNWKKTLLDWRFYYPREQVHYIGKLENSEYLKNNIVNIPIWQFDSGGQIVKY